jgi:hypothetical protein
LNLPSESVHEFVGGKNRIGMTEILDRLAHNELVR